MKDIQDARSYTRTLKARIKEWGGDLVGVSLVDPLRELPVDPEDLLDHFSTAISIAVRLPWATFGEIQNAPTLVYENVYQTANAILDKIAFNTASHLEKDGFYSLPIPASQITDQAKWYGAISHKAVARMAGLGWQGKNLLLITPEYGSSVRLVTVLTTAPLSPDTPIENRCGKCTRCQQACPAGAIKGVNTRTHYQSRNQAVDLDKCLAQLKKHSGMLESYPLKGGGDPPIEATFHQLICGICIKVCPFGKKPKPVLRAD
ncbi:MAG: 4Fe-4S double cluster binding domain-containing protein [Desulfobacter sp.]